MSPRRLWGWEPKTTTYYKYNAQRRLESSTTVREPEFDETDVAFFRALDELEQDTGPHGELLSEALSPDSDPNNPDAGFKYTAGEPAVNYAALAVAQAQERYYSTYKDAITDAERRAHVWVVERVPKH